MQTFRRIELFEDRGRGTLQAYLRRAVVNRINDELRRVGSRPLTEVEDAGSNVAAAGPSPFDKLLAALLLERHPELTPDEVRTQLLGMCTPLPGFDPAVQGHGLIRIV